MTEKDQTQKFDSMISDVKNRDADKRLMTAAKSVIEQQQEMIDRLTNSKVTPLKPAGAVIDKGTWLRVIIADMHGSHADKKTVKALMGDIESIKPKEMIILGDFASCDGFLAEHHTLGYVAQTAYSYADDINFCSSMLDFFQEHVESIDYLFGNHERRVERWCITTALKSRSDRQMIMKALVKSFSVESLLQLEKRGISYVKQGETVDGVFVPATRRVGKSLYMHTGFERGAGGPNAAARHLSKFATNVAAGHTHIGMSLATTIGGSGEAIMYRNPGCLCKRQPLWRHTEPTGWTNGYNIEVCRPDGTFLSLHIPIVDGKSLLVDLAGRLQ